MADPGEGPDSSSIRPVSSLRSRFENLGKDNAGTPVSPSVTGPRFLVSATTTPAPNIRPSTSSGESTPANFGQSIKDEAPKAVPRKLKPGTTPSRPHSMISVTPSQKAPPLVTVDSPSPPGKKHTMSIDMQISGSNTPFRTLTPAQSRPQSPTRAPARPLSRAATPVENRISALLQGFEPKSAPSETGPVRPASPDVKPKSQVAPPINRAGKPKILTQPPTLLAQPNELTTPELSGASIDRSVSPFKTPPRSGNSTPQLGRLSSNHARLRGDSDASSIERLRSDSDASITQRSRGDSDVSFVQRLRGDSDASFVESSSLPERLHFFAQPPTHHQVAAKRDQQKAPGRQGSMPARYRSIPERSQTAAADLPEDRPRLPARPELQIRPGRTSPVKPRSGRTSPLKNQQYPDDGLRRAATFDNSQPRIPANKAKQLSALNQGFDRMTSSPVATNSSHMVPAVPAPRRAAERKREAPPPTPMPDESREDIDMAVSAAYEDSESRSAAATDFPDASSSSRRPPRYRQRPWQIPTNHDTRTFAVCGEYVCTTGHHTKAWNLRTGEQIFDMPHNELMKVSALAFKPSARVEDEGKRIWLGTGTGEIHEVDLPSQAVVNTKSNAHLRREIIRMYRHLNELWTLDDGGDLNVWKPNPKGLPSLDSQPHTFRTPRGHTFSIALGKHLWIATGKDIRVFAPGAKSDTEFAVRLHALSQAGTGDVVSGATLSHRPEWVYFGHQDGKVSIYDRHDFSCVGVVSVSVYRLSSLAGVGEYLWAGFHTGMAYVYDTSTTPWKVKKDWKAHEKHILGINADRSALWKLDRLQVVTLGADGMLRLWDGMLEEDWLESQMITHDSEYCSFREISAAVLTWNAGASKPTWLQQSPSDNDFFREYLTTNELPDIYVFGFQELVDLEDKKLTAKTLFKNKKKDSNDQEYMSHQYRAWRDHLTRCIEDYMPTSQSYALLHTTSLVGLFTCIFVKTSLRPCIKYVHTAEVKRGLGGRYGNKGALVVRMVVDDSSLCFINCHLAAGQTQTIHRNTDINEILDASVLPASPLKSTDVAQHSDVFTGGGDGSMILDHEICILNGDLNYRIDTMGRDTVIKHVHANNLSRLLERDQLLLVRRKNPAFRLRAFQESLITFAPTYKYNLQSDEYDSSEKRRAPAWCDRILYRGLGKVKMEEYRRWEVRVSDHRPVSGRLRLRVKTVDAGRRERVWGIVGKEYEAVRRRVAKAVQLEYLTDVLGLGQREAIAALEQR